MALPHATDRADAALAGIAAAFDYLVYVTPTDDEAAWQRFTQAGCAAAPTLSYRPVDVDLDGLRRRLDAVELDRAGPPAVARLLAAKRVELAGLLDLLAQRGTPAFLATSTAVSGPVGDDLVAVAEAVLAATNGTRPDAGPTVAGTAFAHRAAVELEAYRAQDPALTGAVQLRDDIVTLMVTKDQVLVPEGRRIGAERVEALVHHEVGTHLLTWWNGRRQPLRLLADGLARYEETQEGLGVLAEHLGGRLPPARLAELTLRVVAARSVADGASFVETFRLLGGHGADDHQAFGLATRVHRGGGLVKDAGYLRGLVRIVAHLQAGGDLEPLLVGKLPLDAVDDVAGLLADGVLHPPRLRPRWLEGEGGARLAALRAAPDVLGALLPAA